MRLRLILCFIWVVLGPLVLFMNFRRLNIMGGPRQSRISETKNVAVVDSLSPNRRPQGDQGVICPQGASTEGCGKFQCCWQIRGSKLRAVFTDDPWPQWIAFEALDGDIKKSLPVRGSPLFLLFSDSDAASKSTAVGTVDCSSKEVVQDFGGGPPLTIKFLVFCGQSITVEFTARLPNPDAHYIRFKVKVWSRNPSMPWPKFTKMRLFQFSGAVKTSVTRVVDDNSQLNMDPLDGLPILIEDKFFVGVEHPMAVHHPPADQFVNSTHWDGAAGDITHLSALKIPSEESPWLYGAVFGRFSETSQSRREFVTYLHNERPGRRSPMVHYNSWYDFYSYQDEGFNGGFKDPRPDEELISKLRLDPMKESSCLQRVESFGTELVQKRKATIDSFLWDDGWDDPHTLWEFDTKRFPQRFDAVAAKAASFGSGTGVWISPWGGYGFPQENRVKYGKQFGYETNLNERMETEAFSLAGPKYRKAFIDTATRFVRDDGVNMFKFDGVAGDPRELAVEMEAMLKLITDLRVATTTRNAKRKHIAKKDDDSSDQDKDSIWINLTTGTWPSPFFVLWADSIWRGGPDIASRPRDWEPDPMFWQEARRTGKRPNDGLTRRQRWIRWRALIVYVLVVRQSLFFPLSQLMIHGVVLASHGDALHYGLDKYDKVDFAQEVWSFLGLGLQLQELYLAPRHMDAEAWDILAEGLQWARREVTILRDSHWAFGDPTDRAVYCVASWDIAAQRGFLMLHNPIGTPQKSAPFRLTDVLELPTASSGLRLDMKTVKSVARTSQDWSSRLSDVSEVGVHSACTVGSCTVPAESSVILDLLPTEVLVLAVTPAS